MELIKQIVENIKSIDNTRVIIKKNNAHPGIDDELKIMHSGKSYKFIIVIKKNFRVIHLNQLELSGLNLKNVVLFSDYISPNLRTELKNRNIFYADASGNLFLKTKGFIYFVDNRKNNGNNKYIGNKSFKTAGLKLIYNLLINENLLNKSYRDIAKTVKLSLDSISRILNELKSQEFIINIDKTNKKIVRKKELFEKWVLFYGEILKPKITKGKFSCLDKNFSGNWKNINFNIGKTKWGGESGAYILTNYLRPDFHTVYTEENNDELLKKYKFIMDDKGNIEILNKFWLYDIDCNSGISKSVVHPVLIYADLLNANKPRNYEAAKIIYKKYIDGIISETQ